MDITPDRFAYRCLPMTMANAHGWEILNPSPFEVWWDGQQAPAGLSVAPLPGATLLPTSHFGSGILTWNINGLFRTPPGWNLFVSGSPNRLKDGISPLTGIVETDWTSSTFTMNWKITRTNHVIRFEAGEPICFFFPIQRGVVESVQPKFRSMASDQKTMADYTEWSNSRETFTANLRHNIAANGGKAWQKEYTLGVNSMGEKAKEHQTKINVAEFLDEYPK